MLKRLSPEARSAAHDGPSSLLQPLDIAGIACKAWRHRRYMLLGAASGAALGLAYCLMTQPSYTASSKLLIEPRQLITLSQQSVGEVPIETAYVDSQVEVLNSNSVLSRVVASRDLTKDDEFASAPSFIKQALAFVTGGNSATPAESLTNSAVESLRRKMTVRRVGLTYVLSIAVTTHSPQKSAYLANATATAFLQDNREARAETAEAAAQWLQGRVRELRDLAIAADARVQEFRARNNIVATEKGLMSDQQVTELSSELLQARNQLTEAQARYEKLGAALSNASAEESIIPSELPENSIIRKLQQDMIQNTVRIAELAKANGEKHSSVLKLRAENQSLSASIAAELRKIGASYKSEMDVAAQRVAGLEARLKGAVGTSNATSSAQVSLRDLERESESYRAIYQLSLDKLQEATQQQSFPASEYRIITPAVPVMQKSWPKSTLTIALAIMAGLTLGALGSLARASRDSTMRNAKDVADGLGGKMISIYPLLRELPDFASTIANRTPALRAPARAAKLSLRSLKSGTRCIVIGITSSHRGEGRSTVAASLAASFTASGYRTLLVDADLANPALTTALASGKSRGLRASLADAGQPEVLGFSSDGSGVHFLPSGGAGGPQDGTDWLASAKVAALMNFLQDRYDAVILDLAPLSVSMDAAALAPYADGYVFVAEWGVTDAVMARELIEESGDLSDSVVGVVLSKMPEKRSLLPFLGRRRANDPATGPFVVTSSREASFQ